MSLRSAGPLSVGAPWQSCAACSCPTWPRPPRCPTAWHGMLMCARALRRHANLAADEGEGWDKDEVEARPGQAEGLDGLKIVAASAGDSHTFVLTDDGAVYGCGCFRVRPATHARARA